jgi:hypothetical protein
VRVGKELHKELAIQAMHQGQSLNSYCARLLRGRDECQGENNALHRTSHSRRR